MIIWNVIKDEIFKDVYVVMFDGMVGVEGFGGFWI